MPSSGIYGPGLARKLYEKNLHPRVILGQTDLERLRDQVKSGDARKIMNALRKKVKRLVDWVVESDDVPALLRGDGSHNSTGSQVYRALTDMAMVAAIDEDQQTLGAVERIFKTVLTPSYSNKGPGACLAVLAHPYDLLFGRLDEKVNAKFRGASSKLIREMLQSKPGYYRGSGANMMLGTAMVGINHALAIAGDDGVRDLSANLDELIQRFEATLHTAINADGYPEEDIGYGTHVTAALARTAEWLRRAGLYDAYESCPRLARFGRSMLHFVQPWGEDLSNTGDHGDDFGLREFVLARQATETDDPTLLWLLGTLHYHHGKVHPENTLPEYYVEVPLRKGFRTPASYGSLLVVDELKRAVHPKKAEVPTQYRDKARGIVSFRSGWDVDDTFVVFDGSHRNPSGQGHCHASCGHFSLSAVGEYFAIDTGRYNNEQSCHNVVLVDGKSGETTDGEWRQVYRHGNLIDYAPGEFCDFAAVDSSYQHDCYWARRYFGFVKGRGSHGYAWTVEDMNKANDWAEFWWQLQTCPENTIRTRKKSATIQGWRHGNQMDVHFVLPSSKGFPKPYTLSVEQDVGTTSSYKYIKDIEWSVSRYERPADMVHGPVYARPRLLGKVGGYNGRFMTIMLPRNRGEKAARVLRVNSIDNSLAAKVVHEKVEDTIVFAYEHQLLEADGVRGRGQWCVVRRSKKNGRVLSWELGHGTSLEVDGKRLV